MMPVCTLVVDWLSEHHAQLYTGFEILERLGVLTLRQRFEGADAGILRVEIANGPVLAYDMHDSAVVTNPGVLANCDWYFKRSWPDTGSSVSTKITPTALNYSVHAAFLSRHRLARTLHFRRSVRAAIDLAGVPLSHWLGRHSPIFAGTTEQVSARRADPANDRVLFLARAWDPDAPEIADQPAQREERHVINERRAACIRVLRKEVGPAFTGGLSPDHFSSTRYPDVVLANDRTTRRNHYLQSVSAHGVCVATKGLHQSNGWKLAEYVAFQRAIVSEALAFAVPHGFAEGTHYLAFSSVDTCVEQVLSLRTNHTRRAHMMQANAAYYRDFLHPAMAVARDLQKVGVLSLERVNALPEQLTV